MAEIKITISDNGPYLVTGPVTLVDTRGNSVEGASEKMALCRCGASSNKPFCDGTHREIRFTGT